MTPESTYATQERPVQPAATRPPSDPNDRTGPFVGSLALSSDPAGLPNLPGYETLGELGRGGMGVVYRAHDRKLNRAVAIKMVLGGIIAGPHALVRFLAEAEALAALDHPNVVHVFDRGEYQGLPYFVMEFCPGGSLGGKVKDHPLPAREAAEVVERLAGGVAAAHARNILHRDLKPDNVLLAADGTPKVTDFGLAKRFDDSGEAGAGLTATGAVMGTPSYMAPEQAKGDSKRVGPAADVYALGAILYRLVAGRPPFLGTSSADTIRQVIEDEPVSPTQLVPGLPRDLATICLKCLNKEPARRYASANELAADVRRFLDGRPIQARPVRFAERAVKWVNRNPVVTGSAVAIAAALIGGTAVSYVKYLEARRQTEIAIQKETLSIEKEALAIQRAAEAEAARTAESERVKERDNALKTADARAKDLKYQLGVSNMVLAAAAYDTHNVVLAAERLDEVPAEQRGCEWHFMKRQVRGGLFTLYGHTNGVAGVAFSPDGRQVATASYDKTARVWDARTGAVLVELKGHTGFVVSVAISPDGRRVATASYDKTARVWDARTGAVLVELKGHTEGVLSVAFSPDGRRLATASLDATARVWDARTGAALIELKGYAGAVRGVAFSPDGTRVATAGDYEARMWDTRTGAVLLKFPGHTQGVTSVAVSPDGTRVVTGSYDQTGRVWDARTGAPLAELSGHMEGVIGVAFSPDGRRVATASLDETARVWDARTGNPLSELKGHTHGVKGSTLGVTVNTHGVTGVAWSPDGTRLLTGSGDKTGKVWDARTGTAVVELKGHTNWVMGMAFSPDGTRLATASGDKTAKIWDARTGTVMAELRGHTGIVMDAAFSPEGSRVITGSLDQTARVWDARTGAVLAELKGHAGAVRGVAFSPDGRCVITGSLDRTARVWDARTGAVLVELKGHTSALTSVAFSRDGARMATGSNDQTARVWDARGGAVLAELKGHTSTVNSVAFSPDGTQVATGSTDATAKLWDVRTGAVLVTLSGHTQVVTSVAFCPDGTRLATASHDHTARVWDTQTGTALIELRGHTDRVNRVAFSPDGTRVATCGNDYAAQVLDARPGPQRTSGPIPNVIPPGQVSPDGQYFARSVGNRTELISLAWDAEEIEYRLIHTRPKISRYSEGYQQAKKANDRWAVHFYLDRLLSIQWYRADLYQLRTDDACLIARSAFHHTSLGEVSYDRDIVQTLAVAGDRLARRLVAQQRLRDGQPKLAIPLLFDTLLTRPVNGPPVEELLLARAYLDLKQPDEARRFYGAAAGWLDRPRDPMRAANVVTHAINPINAVAEAFKPIDDPRHNPFDWESWHECDVFRADVKRRLGGP